MSLRNQINSDRIPKHVAVIMDGNGRWAKQKGEHRIFGHAKGVESVRETLTAASEIGVDFLTLYAFSTENWNRPKEEVDALMELLVNTIAQEIDTLNKNEVKLQAIGDLDNLPGSCKEALQEAINQTSSNTRITLILALSYSSRWEIKDAIQRISKDIESKKLGSNEINEELISSYLATANYPDPELLIRTSGEVRISNFLLWQLAYTELYFTDTLWPDFKKENFFEAIINFQSRERRFGKVSEQLQEK